MVTLLYKWWTISALSLGLFLNSGIKPEMTVKKDVSIHPIHISTLEIEHNMADKNLEITCKIFWDDFETALTKTNNSKRVDLTNEKNLELNNKLISAYINNHLSLTIDGKPVSLSFVGFEKEDAVIYSYLEVNNISAVKKVSMTNNIMHDMFEDQTEIIHVIVNGNRKSTKLDYPAKVAEFNF
jgi:hypothetical protein